MKAGRGMVRRTRRFAIAAVAVLALTLVVSCGPVAPAQHSALPLGYCWDGVLSQDPLHCYALEEAEREELIDVTALYEAPGGGPLYVWLNQTGPVSDEVYAFLKTKSKEFYDRWPDRVPLICMGLWTIMTDCPRPPATKTLCSMSAARRPSARSGAGRRGGRFGPPPPTATASARPAGSMFPGSTPQTFPRSIAGSSNWESHLRAMEGIS